MFAWLSEFRALILFRSAVCVRIKIQFIPRTRRRFFFTQCEFLWGGPRIARIPLAPLLRAYCSSWYMDDGLNKSSGRPLYRASATDQASGILSKSPPSLRIHRADFWRLRDGPNDEFGSRRIPPAGAYLGGAAGYQPWGASRLCLHRLSVASWVMLLGDGSNVPGAPCVVPKHNR